MGCGHVRDKQRRQTLTDACETQNVALVERWLKVIDPERHQSSALKTACYTGNLEIVKRLMDAGYNPAGKAFLAACLGNNATSQELVRLLLADPRVDPTCEMNTALSYACKEGRVDIIECLLDDARVDPSYPNNLPLCCAAREGHVAVLEKLMKDARVVAKGFKGAMDDAIMYGNIEIAELLHEK